MLTFFCQILNLQPSYFLLSFTFVDALVTVANSVFTIFQVISATDQFERGPRKGTSSPSLGEEKTR